MCRILILLGAFGVHGAHSTLISPAAFVGSLLGMHSAAAKVVWADGSSIKRCNYDGSVEETVVTGLGTADGLDLYRSKGLVVIADAEDSEIVVAGVDGSNPVTILSSADGVQDPFGIAVDEVADKVYWTDAQSSGPHVKRANLDGSDIETVVSDLVWPTHCKVYHDPNGDSWLLFSDSGDEWKDRYPSYYPNGGTPASVRKVSTDLSDPTESVVVERSDYSSSDVEHIYGFDIHEDWVYFESTRYSSSYTTVIAKAPIDRSTDDWSVTELYSVSDGVYGLAVDVDAGYVFWMSFQSNDLFRGTTDGEGAVTEIYSNGEDPWGVVVWRVDDRCSTTFCVGTPEI